MVIKRGDIFYADLNPSFGSEQGGIRPVLVVQNNIGNIHSPTIVVLPITSMKKRPLPVHTRVDDTDLLTDGSIVLAEQIRTIDKRRLKEKMGSVDDASMSKVNEAISISFGIFLYCMRYVRNTISDFC